MNCQTSVIHRPTGKVGGRWVTCVPYDPSLEMLDEGMTNGRLKGNQSNRSSWTARPPAALADWVTTGIQRPVLINKVVAQQRSRRRRQSGGMPSSEDLKDVRGAGVGNPPSVVDILRE
jgi:hypothetical protein